MFQTNWFLLPWMTKWNSEKKCWLAHILATNWHQLNISVTYYTRETWANAAQVYALCLALTATIAAAAGPFKRRYVSRAIWCYWLYLYHCTIASKDFLLWPSPISPAPFLYHKVPHVYHAVCIPCRRKRQLWFDGGRWLTALVSMNERRWVW